MLFKHPELLWALFLLLIPIFIHLVQLRRFKKTPFTNVKLLQEIISESRRSKSIKKWLLLMTRMLLITALVFAFSQPFFAENTALKKKERVFYIDNSFSMQAKLSNGTLLENAVQEILKHVPEDQEFSLFTNDGVFRKVFIKDIKNNLLSLSHSANQLSLEEVYLKANTLFKDRLETVNDLVIISDFQANMVSKRKDYPGNTQTHLIQITPDNNINVAIDTAYISNTSSENITLTGHLSSNGQIKSTPVSLFNEKQLIAKTAAIFGADNKASVTFSLPQNESINGLIEISDPVLQYDNELYFNINKKEKIKVLSIGDDNSNYLERIFSKDEFDYINSSIRTLNYSVLGAQNLIIVNELQDIPGALQSALITYKNNGGSLVFVPAFKTDFKEYNNFLSQVMGSSFTSLVSEHRIISNINFSHPLYRNVFDKEINNFQYPSVEQYYKLKSILPKILSYANQEPFLCGIDGNYLFTSPLSDEYSNITKSPLIVPTFYQIGVNSLKLPSIYEVLGQNTTIDIPIVLIKDNVLSVTNNQLQYIPRQQAFANKTTLFFDKDLSKAGIYSITNDKTPIQNISFNPSRKESQLNYIDLKNLTATTKNNAIASFFDQLEKENSIAELWKWFVILALAFILIEVLIQKYLK
ncbi:N-terminal double-transmembrane domain-containing protein [Arenibacter nanhaiticus]|uniref:N-terminal double-transmembrane domain-containing protein n=1 Tax=Arenibacter nanhaiticus TaxID=558155 RepID=A0A1M6DJQ4_9FLAO|nr:BatA domain-containing protein [Arenibacter nanhaiticus]SHI73422.1 N-terminal double-transmembrane domain-containing protein [Arenibacter nanhaiticus]